MPNVQGVCVLADFPAPGETISLTWQEAQQNFVITDGAAPPADSPAAPRPPSTLTGVLENPSPASFQSGIGVISGWVCDAEAVVIEIDGMPLDAAYGTSRADTAGVCGDTDSGFGLLFNWNLLGDGEHSVVALVDGVELGRATVTVSTLGEEFVRGAAGRCVREDFPTPKGARHADRNRSPGRRVEADGSSGRTLPGEVYCSARSYSFSRFSLRFGSVCLLLFYSIAPSCLSAPAASQ